jgi:hypothetical protein
MIVRTRAMSILAVAAAIVLGFAVPAHSQGVGSIGSRKSGGTSTPPKIDTGPPVDEKAYKAALDRIPEPTRKYDPWGVARPTESAKPTKKSN